MKTKKEVSFLTDGIHQNNSNGFLLKLLAYFCDWLGVVMLVIFVEPDDYTFLEVK